MGCVSQCGVGWVGVRGGMLNPMMASLNRQCRLPDSRLSDWLCAQCDLMEMARDCGSQIHYYCCILPYFLVSGISTFSQGGGGVVVFMASG